MLPGSYPFRISLNGLETSFESWTFHVLPEHSIHRIEPSHGPVTGGTRISVFGERFVNVSNSTDILCSFKQSLVPEIRTIAIFMSTTKLVCVSPPSFVEGSVTMRIGLNGWDFDGAMPFLYDPIPQISSVFPTALYKTVRTGFGTVVTIRGHHLRSYIHRKDEVRCRFGTVVVNATRAVDDEVLCIAPQQPNLPTGPVFVDVTLNAQQFTTSGAAVIYWDAPTIQELSVDGSPMSGESQPLVVSTTQEVIYQVKLFCHFGAYSPTVGRWINSTSLECPIPPAHDASSVALRITSERIEHGHTPSAAAQFTFHHSMSIKRLVPDSGLAAAEIVVFVVGGPFLNGITYCRLGDAKIQLQSKVISPSLMECKIPARSSQSVVLISV